MMIKDNNSGKRDGRHKTCGLFGATVAVTPQKVTPDIVGN